MPVQVKGRHQTSFVALTQKPFLMKRMPESIVVLVTCGSEEEAAKIALSLVEEHLAACVNLVSPVRSIYRWEGKIWDEKEWILIIKTQKKRFEQLEKKVKSLHSYSVPEIISLSIVEGSPAYLKWLEEMTEK
jgi:periplasmic divalent cation tolerance protein